MLADASLRPPAYFRSEIKFEKFSAFFENFALRIAEKEMEQQFINETVE